MLWMPSAARRLLAKVMVFVVSGVCHSYFLFTGGRPFLHQWSMFSFFALQLVLLQLEDSLQLSGRVWVYGSQAMLCPLFLEPVLQFMGL